MERCPSSWVAGKAAPEPAPMVIDGITGGSLVMPVPTPTPSVAVGLDAVPS
jgi:hypothetical protein